MKYYGTFYRSALPSRFARMTQLLPDVLDPTKVRAAAAFTNAKAGWKPVTTRAPRGCSPPGDGAKQIGDPSDKSRMNREVHVRFCGSRWRFPPATPARPWATIRR